jgi:antitoxin PrlF
LGGTPADKQPWPFPASARARLRSKSQLTLPEEARQALQVNEGDEIEFRIEENGMVTVRGYTSVPTDHAWLYETGQGTARSSNRALAAWQGTMHASATAMFGYLDTLGAADS